MAARHRASWQNPALHAISHDAPRPARRALSAKKARHGETVGD
jgi:hypothetical protein